VTYRSSSPEQGAYQDPGRISNEAYTARVVALYQRSVSTPQVSNGTRRNTYQVWRVSRLPKWIELSLVTEKSLCLRQTDVDARCLCRR
jgi:hypothetical protein